MNILIVGNGGREHTLAWKISQSTHCDTLYIAPGNSGTKLCGINIPIEAMDIAGLKKFCLESEIDLVVVGPEAPLVAGLTDAFREGNTDHIGIIGPSAYAAQLEGSKAFAKKFMQKYNIPTAAYIEVTQENIEAGFVFLESQIPPYVLKADGLAGGKGVLIIDNIDEAKSQLTEMLSGKFGSASATVVIEEFLEGIEFSVFALTDGQDYVLLPEAKDYKRIGEGDTGLNTGGMGAVSPVPFLDEELWTKVIDKVVKPTINGLKTDNFDYTGFVFFGLINVNGEPMVIEYNCRLGDPETEVIIPRIENDLVVLLLDAVKGNLKNATINISNQSAATVMMVSGGYPEDFERGKVISGTEDVQQSILFHAGTKDRDDAVITNGGRIMAITTLADDFRDAVKTSISNAELIQYENKYYRTDIGFDL